MDPTELLRIVDAIHRDKNIDKEIVFEGIEAALVSAAKKHYGEDEDIVVQIDRDNGNITGTHDGAPLDPEEMAQIWGIKGIGVAPRLSWRLFIPIHLEKEMVSWTTRAVGNNPQRYISASEKEESLPHKTLVYGQDLCSHSIIICEGPGDAWKIGPGAGALFGTAYTPSQVRKLARHPYRFIVFDSSYEAQRKADELADQLAVFPGQTMRVELDAEDPGSASDQEIQRLRRAAKIT